MIDSPCSTLSIPSAARKRKRISIPLSLILLFCVVFFPVYFTQHRSSSSSTASAGAASTARARTTPGAVWSQSSKFKDLNDLRIEYYSSGQNNSKILTSLPNNVWNNTPPQRRRRRDESNRRPNRAVRRQDLASITTHSHTPTHTTTNIATSTHTAGSVLEIFYPADSYTPSAHPIGGTQFYALTPFDLSIATCVTFNYSVFFPVYYDFVLGGKLPGLYGGTEGCGGGNKAEDCWSSRMAWRPHGSGELYAYLPQEKQNITALLQVPPYSFVNTDYGISLGRGSFNLTRGEWTNISQTISLSNNTTHPNGVFDIKINNHQAIYYNQVYFPTNIKGILFSTFFGGSTKDWATPFDQYSYFKDFSITINAVKN